MGHLTPRDGPPDIAAGSHSHEIRLFTKCRNERLRLPAFLRHYRQLGVDRFFVADNASSDGSIDYLAAQPDVHVFTTTESFRAARGGTVWLNEMLREFGSGHWCVTVDVDELLFYPGIERAPLRELTEYLDRHDYQALPCLLLDLYPEGRLRDCAYVAEGDLIDAARYFDGIAPRLLPHSQCPYFLAYGGVRERVFFPESWPPTWRRHAHVTFFHRILPRLPFVRSARRVTAHRPVFPPCLTKVPLVRWDASSEYLNVNHFVSERKVAPEIGALLHFKLLQDFDARATEEVSRGEYYDGAIEFRRYAAELRRDPDLTFRFDKSVRLEDSAQLVALGMMRDSDAWREARQASAAGARGK